jgi:hypothetical protein
MLDITKKIDRLNSASDSSESIVDSSIEKYSAEYVKNFHTTLERLKLKLAKTLIQLEAETKKLKVKGGDVTQQDLDNLIQISTSADKLNYDIDIIKTCLQNLKKQKLK